MTRIRVMIDADDPLVRAGLRAYLEDETDFDVFTDNAAADIQVTARPRTLRGVRPLGRPGPPVVVIIEEMTKAELLTAIRGGVVAIIPVRSLTPESLARTIRLAAAGAALLAPTMVRDLIDHLNHLEQEFTLRDGIGPAGLTLRETAVLELMSYGLDTEQVAQELNLSARTVKAVVQQMTARHNLRNRVHAVAYALRLGAISMELEPHHESPARSLGDA